ncbi:MAG: MaoC family dehydratase [Bacteroidota bacterium]
MKQFEDLAELSNHVGEDIGKSALLKITQERIDEFAKVTMDEQWVHTQPEMAAKHSPYKATIAHGYLTQSLIPYLISQVFTVSSVKMGVNYGSDKVRFMSPVLVDSHIYLSVKLLAAEEIQKGRRLKTECTVYIDGNDKPACVAELITLMYE